MKPYKDFSPDWYTEVAPERSYRSIYKWGAPDSYKIPRENLYKLVKETFGLTDEDFKERKEMGLEEVKYDIPCALDEKTLADLTAIVGSDKISTDDYDRLQVAYGQTMLDLIRLRKAIVENVPDVVLYPSDKEQIQKIVSYASEHNIPLYVYGGGSSVTRGPECVKGGISLNMQRNFNKVVEFNEINHTITVQSGMLGPDLEKYLNNAPDIGARDRYTCGHFPQSFEHSAVGGWVVTRGAGQNSTYYGKIEDIVVCQEYATPIGEIKTDKTYRSACGPSLDQIMMGSEGTFGVLTDVTLRFFLYRPENHFKFSFMFKSWEDAMTATREVMQSEIGYPSVFRLSDQEETEVMMRMYGISGTPLEAMLKVKGFKKNEKCLLLGFTDGERKFCKNMYRKIKAICKKYGAVSLTGYVTSSWEKGRFSDPYLRDNMQDFGIVIDTLECSVNWDNMEQVHQDVRAYCKSRPNTICMTHISHFYPQGVNLYFIFITPCDDLEEFKAYHKGILAAIQQSGAAISHHHGIGKLFAPWLEGYIGKKEMGAIEVLKNYFDPNGVMNPGGTLGLDLDESQKYYPEQK